MTGSGTAFAAVSVNPSTLPNGTLGVAYDVTVNGAGGTGPYTFAVTAGALPTGITLNPTTGEISGTPSAQGVYNYTIRATDSLAATGTRAYTTSVGTFSLAVQPNTLPNGTQGVAYNQTLTAVGGNPPYTFVVSSGALPTGLTLTSAGVLSGTPSAAGSFTFIIQADDSTGNTGFRTYNNLVIGGNILTIAPPTLPNGTQGVGYSQTVTASGGTGGPYTYSVSAGSLPSGLSLNTGTGAITGTPTAGGSFNFTIRAVDGNNNFGTQAYTVLIGGNSLTINPSSLPNGTVATAYSQSVTASGGTGGPYTYSITSGALPNGLSLNAGSGAITGTPTTGGAFSFTMHAVDGNTNFGNRNYTINIGSNSLTVTPGALPGGTQGVSYSQTVGATGGTAPYTFAVTSGALPNGLSLNAGSGLISGTPSASGPFNFTIRATDPNFNTGFQAYTVNIAPVPLTVNPASLPNGTQGLAYSQTITTSGGTAPFTYAVLSGALPTGLSLNPGTGAITGTPTASGNFNFTIQSTDSTPNTGTRNYSVNIGTNSLTVSPASLPNGSQGIAYNQTVTASGGTGPYTFAVTSGALPAGLSLNPGSGAITGTPSGSGLSNFTIQATDINGNIGNRAYAVNIGTAALTVNPASLPNGSQNIAYSQTVTASGGTGGPYSFAVTVGALPAGLTLYAASGDITGTPTGSGTSNFTIRAIDTNGNTGTRAYSVNIGTATLTINAPTLPNASQGSPYNQTVTATGGTGPYVLSLLSGTLPAGLTFNPGTGAITGTPTGSGVSTFTIRAVDANGNTGSRVYTINVGTNALTVNPPTLPPAPQGRPYTQPLSVVGGTGPFVFSLQSGALPPGLTMSAAGVITGTPTVEGNYPFTVFVLDVNGNFGTRVYALSTSRGNPANDPEVQALVAAQAATTRRFTDTQTSNVLRHLEGLHDNFNPCGLNFGINPSTYNAPPPVYSSDPMGPTIGPGAGSAFPPINKDPYPPAPRPATPASTCDPSGPPIAIWASGAVEFGRMTSTGLLVDSNKFTTSGVTAGMDIRVADRLIIGGAFGYGADHSDLGLKGTVSDASTLNGIAYASYKLTDSVFLDAVLGHGSLNFNNTRWVTLDSTTVSGKRDGNTWFGSFSVTSEFRRGMFKFAPYARIDAMTAQLNKYSESGDPSMALTYQATTVSSVAGVVGLRGSVDISNGGNIFTPNMRVEYKRALDQGFTQSMFYTQTGAGQVYAINQADTARDIFTGALGLRARFGNAATLDLEYSLSGTPSREAGWQSQMLRAMAHWNFEAN